MDQAFKNVNDAVFANSFDESTNVYAKWSENYDKDLEVLGCNHYRETGMMFEKYGRDSKTLLDVGGGTALMVEQLRKLGYGGNVDILDANLQMLVQGEKKQVNLRNIICHCVNEDGILPLKNESYDAIICIGAFNPNHIPATALKGVFNVIKNGGVFIVTNRTNSAETYKQQFDEVVQELIDEGKIELLEEKEYSQFNKLDTDVKSVVSAFKKLC